MYGYCRFAKANPMIFEGLGTVMPVWQISRVDPGYLYVIESSGRYKIGKTKNTKGRLKAAKTWLPDMVLVGLKPFWGMSHHERQLHIGLARYWYSGEWFSFEGDDDVRDSILENFIAFSDVNPDMNSVNFAYWCHDGMLEFQMEMHEQQLSLPKFRRQESGAQKLLD